jgi:hypothetical protein
MICASTCWLLLVGALPGPAATAATQSSAPSGRVLAFLAAPPAQQAADPTVAVPVEAFAARDGDELRYLLRVGDPCIGTRGLELGYADGRRVPAPACTTTGVWSEVRVPLRAGSTVQALELVARGGNGAEIQFQVDDVRIERADGPAIDVFRDELTGNVRRLSGMTTSAGAIVVALEDEFVSEGVRTRAEVSDPWAAIDLSALRALEREADALDPASLPRGLTWTGPCVPLRFARGTEPASFAARGQRIGFEPLDGGRFYELWLAVANTTDAAFDTEIDIQGVDRQRTAIEVRIPAEGPGGYAPAEARGYPARGFALLEVDIASATSLESLQLPDDARLRILAVTITWRRDGATDPRFRERWLRRAAALGTDLGDEDRADLTRYLANRRAAVIFGGGADEGSGDRALFQALLEKDTRAFHERLTDLLAAQAEVARDRKSARIDLIAAVPGADDERSAVADLAAALAEGVLPTDLPVLGGDGATIAALARSDPAAFAQLAERVRAGTWRTLGASFDRRSSARLGAVGLAHKLALEKSAERELLGSASGIERLDGDRARLQNLPQLLGSAGSRLLLLEGRAGGSGTPFAQWRSGAASVVTFEPAVRVEGPLRFDPARWRAWTAAAAGNTGRPPIPVLCDVSAPVARATLAQAAELQASDLAPQIAWSSIEAVVEAAGTRARSWNPPELQPFARDGMHAELAALAAVRAAEREIGRLGVVESLAVLEGAPDTRAALDAAWRELIGAAARDAATAAAEAHRVGVRAENAAKTRLARLQSAAPPAGAGVPLAVLDVLTWPRASLIEFPDAELRVAGVDGDVPMQRTAGGGVLFEFAGAGTTPAALRVRRDPLTELKAPVRVRLEGWTIRTDDLEVAIDPTTGRIAQLRLPRTDVDLLRDEGCQLTWNAPGSAPEPVDRLESIEYVERGPLRAVVRCVHSSARARVVTEIRVTSGPVGLEIRSRATLADRGGDVVATLPLRYAAANALVSIPLGSAAIPADAEELRALDGWAAATNGRATLALLGESGVAYHWNDRAFGVVLAEAGADAEREASFHVLGNVGAWKAAGLDAALLERVASPVCVAFESTTNSVTDRGALVRIARIEPDGRRTTGLASGLVPLTIEPGPDGTIDVRFLEVRGDVARVQIDLAREPFGARRVDLLGNSHAAVTVTGRSLDVTVGAGHFETVRVRLGP